MNDYWNSETYKKAIKNAEMIRKSLPKIPEVPQGIFTAAEELSKVLSNINQSLPTLDVLQKFTEITEVAQKRVLELEGLSEEEFENRYKDSIEASRNMGRCGWVISQYTSGKVYLEWYQRIQNGNESSIEEYFYSNGIITKIIEVFDQTYKTGVNGQYYVQAKKYYDLQDYMTSAMYFLALLDNRISELVEFPKGYMRNREKYTETGFRVQKASDFAELSIRKGTFTKIIFFSELYPSLIEYLNRVFFDGMYSFNKKVEPPYLNRNWLMHGKMKRTVERYEIVQIMNALCVLEFLMKKRNE